MKYLAFAPILISLIGHYFLRLPPLADFLLALWAIIPLAGAVKHATERLAASTGPAIGGLLNVTFGNLAELVLALFMLVAGHEAVVKAQITGAIMGNSLFGFGLAIVAGCVRRPKLQFNKHKASLLSSLMLLSLIALTLPAVFDLTERHTAGAVNPTAMDLNLSVAASVVLIVLYLGNLFFTLVTHHGVFEAEPEETPLVTPIGKPLAVLIVSAALIAVESEILSGVVEEASGALGVTPFFLGMTVLALIGSVAEYLVAVHFARKGEIGVSISVTLGSTIQIALLIAPLLVLVSLALGTHFDLVFSNPLELLAIAASALVVNSIAQDGEVTWFEGAMLLGVYVLFGIAFLFVTPG